MRLSARWTPDRARAGAQGRRAAHGLRVIKECAGHGVDGPTQAILAQRVRAVLDALSALDIDRRHAVRMLMPGEFTELADRDPLWEQAYEHGAGNLLDVRDELTAILADDDWADAPDDLSDRDRVEFSKFAQSAARRQLGLDCRGFLKPEHHELLEIAEEVAAEFLADPEGFLNS